MLKHIFFDLDRTLWDFEKNSKTALEGLFIEHKIHEKVKNFYDFLNIYQNVNRDLWVDYGKGKITKEFLRITRFAKTLDKLKIYDEELALKLDVGYVNNSPFQTNLFPNAIETLTELKNSGYKMHIITNGFKEVQQIKLENSKLAPFFEKIVSSEEAGASKPNAKIFKHSLELAQAKINESVMIGDDLNTDIGGANAIGMQSIHFDPENRYRKRNSQPKISDLNELPELLIWMFKNC